MADQSFEARLDEGFARAPMFADTEAFAVQVERRLAARARLRAGVVAAAGLTGGALTLAALTSLVASTGELVQNLDRLAGFAAATPGAVWMAAGVVAAALFALRANEET